MRRSVWGSQSRSSGVYNFGWFLAFAGPWNRKFSRPPSVSRWGRRVPPPLGVGRGVQSPPPSSPHLSLGVGYVLTNFSKKCVKTRFFGPSSRPKKADALCWKFFCGRGSELLIPSPKEIFRCFSQSHFDTPPLLWETFH